LLFAVSLPLALCSTLFAHVAIRIPEIAGYAVFKQTAPAIGIRFGLYYLQFDRASPDNGGAAIGSNSRADYNN
jgi:hypothetical protein